MKSRTVRGYDVPELRKEAGWFNYLFHVASKAPCLFIFIMNPSSNFSQHLEIVTDPDTPEAYANLIRKSIIELLKGQFAGNDPEVKFNLQQQSAAYHLLDFAQRLP